MLWKRLLYSISCAFVAFASSIPRREPQQPLIPEQQPASSELNTINVMLAFTENGSTMEQQVEIPLHERIFPGDLPIHLSAIKIITAVTGQGRSVSLERLDKIMCRIVPEVSGKERRAAESDPVEKDSPWFALKDGSVRPKDASSKWFLGGRRIESYECR